nr:helix-turn-helix domain-containing protein [Saccharopolyspora gloriosae]
MNNAPTPSRRHHGLARIQLAHTLKTLYEKGASIRTLHKETQYSYGKIHRLLHEAGTTFRPRGGHRPHPPN